MNLTQTSARGLLWITGGQLFNQVLSLAGTAILARLLLPADFGLVGMAIVVTGLLALVNELGLAEAIIQRQQLEDRHLSTVFWVNIIFSSMLTLLTFLVAPLAAQFFNQPDLQPILKLLSVGFVLGSFGTVHRAIFTRQMKFHMITFVRMVTNVVRVFTTVILALIGFGVWSLVWGSLVGTMVDSCMMWLLSQWRPALILDKQGLRELLSFSLNLLGANLIGYFGINITDIITGKYLGAATLGLYTVAANVPNTVRVRLVSSIPDVIFPAFSSIQDNDERMRRGYEKVAKYISLIVFPCLTGLCILTPEFVLIVYGPNWLDAVLPMRILCFGAICSTLGVINGPVQKAKGRTDYFLYLNIASLITSLILTLIGVNYGLMGVALASSAKSFIFVWVVFSFTSSLIKIPLLSYFRALSSATIGSVIMAIVLIIYRFYAGELLNGNNILIVVSSIILGAMIYLFTLKRLKEQSLNEGFLLVQDVLTGYFPIVRQFRSKLFTLVIKAFNLH